MNRRLSYSCADDSTTQRTRGRSGTRDCTASVSPLALLAAIEQGRRRGDCDARRHGQHVGDQVKEPCSEARTGRTLYHLTAEKRGKIGCTGTCAQAWPPLTIKKGSKPTAGTGIKPAKFGTIKRPDGSMQVTYNGYALYRYGDDTKKGDAKKEGEDAVWGGVSPAGTLVKASGGTTRHAVDDDAANDDQQRHHHEPGLRLLSG